MAREKKQEREKVGENEARKWRRIISTSWLTFSVQFGPKIGHFFLVIPSP